MKITFSSNICSSLAIQLAQTGMSLKLAHTWTVIYPFLHVTQKYYNDCSKIIEFDKLQLNLCIYCKLLLRFCQPADNFRRTARRVHLCIDRACNERSVQWLPSVSTHEHNGLFTHCGVVYVGIAHTHLHWIDSILHYPCRTAVVGVDIPPHGPSDSRAHRRSTHYQFIMQAQKSWFLLQTKDIVGYTMLLCPKAKGSAQFLLEIL